MNDKALPDVSQEKLDPYYKDMGRMEVLLDTDPLRFGPKRMNGKFALIRNFLAQVEKIFMETSHSLSIYKRRLRMKNAELELRRNDMLANDPETRAGRSVADREAIVYNKLISLVNEIDILDCGVIVLDQLLTVTKAKRADLKDTQNRLRDQLKVCQEEIHLGSQWGDVQGDDFSNQNLDIDLTPGQDYSGNVLDEIEELVGSIPGEIHLEIKERHKGERKNKTLEDTTSTYEVEEFLDSFDDPTMFVGVKPKKPLSKESLEDILGTF